MRAKIKESNSENGDVTHFSFKSLSMATQNFREANLIGEGGFGSVYRGTLPCGTVCFLVLSLRICWDQNQLFKRNVLHQFHDQVVAIKQLNLEGHQGNQEFMVEVLMLSLLHHPNLVNLLGYCAYGDQRLLVYEFMPMGSLENHLFGNLRRQHSSFHVNVKINTFHALLLCSQI